jgi:DNA-binding IclR family transcriptional regulator
VSISAPAFRIDANKQGNLREALIQTGREISRRLGYSKERE